MKSKGSKQQKKTEEKPDDKEKLTINEDPHIGHSEHAPQYMKDNDHITHGYRINFNTPKKIVRSLFMIHNQSVNIWTHLGAALIVCGIIGYFLFLIFTNRGLVSQQISVYTNKLSNSLDNYMKGLQNITIFTEMQNFKNARSEDLEQIKNSLLQSYQKVTTQIGESADNIHNTLGQKYTGIISEISKNYKTNLNQFQKLKKQFEKVFLPFLFSEVNTRLNSTLLNQFKQKLLLFKQQIDNNAQYLNFAINKEHNPENISRWPIVVFLLSALTCLTCSACFHLFYPMSKRSYTVFSRFDYAGISILIAGSGFPIFYYSMYCNFYVAVFYLTISTIGAIFVFSLSLFEKFHLPQHSSFRGLIYASYGLHYVFPITHLLIDIVFFNKNGDPFLFITSFPYIVLLGASYLVGVSIYINKCPQRKYPGKFNMCGHSHQIWHCFVIMGIIFTYIAATNAFQMRKSSICPLVEQITI